MGASIYPDNGNGDYHFPVNSYITYVIRDLTPIGKPMRPSGTANNPAGLRFEVYMLTGLDPHLGNHEFMMFRGAYADSESACVLIDQIIAEVANLPRVQKAAIIGPR